MKNFCKLIGFIALSCTFLTSAQAQVGSITTSSTSCSLTISSCEGDTLILTPQDQASYANYKWYFGSVAPANEITAANAAANNVVATNFASNSPTIKVIANGGTYILTGEYATPAGCAAINDTFVLNFTPRPVANNATLALCEKTAGSGEADFTLTNADVTVTGGATGVAVTYYETLADARSATAPLSSPYTSGTKTLYARVENTTTGCYRTATLTLNINSKPVITDATTTICEGATVNLTTQIISYNSYSNPAWTLTTAGGTTVSTPTAVKPNTTTTYVLVADAGGCKDTAQVVVNVNARPVITDASTAICNGTSVDLTSLITSYGTYSNPVWTLSTVGGTSIPNPAAVTPNATLTYVLVAENGSGCKDTANVVVTVNPLPDFTLSKPVACPGTSEEVNITGLTNANAATAQLKLDAGAYAAYPNPAIITGLSVGSHTFTIQNENGCETAKSITISPVPARICLPVTVTRSIGSN